MNSGPPNLGGPTPPSGPNLGGSKGSGPNLGPKPASGPSSSSPQQSVVKEPSKSVKSEIEEIDDLKIYFSQYFIRWEQFVRKLRRSYIDFLSREMRVNVTVSTNNALFKNHIMELMKGQLEYLDETMEVIRDRKDPLTKKLKRRKKYKGTEVTASTIVFERLREIISYEIERMEEGNIDIFTSIKDDLKNNQDTRMEPRSCFWLLIFSGLILNNIKEKVEEEFEVLMRVSLEYDNPYKHTLILFLHFVYYLIRELPPFGKEDSQTNMVVNAKETGYSMAHWIKYRYGTSSQEYMEFERFVSYYVRSFGMIRGRAPKYKRDAYYSWIDRTFKAMEETFLPVELFTKHARGLTIEGIIAGMIDRMEAELERRKYDMQDRLLNQPLGGEGAIKLLQWMLETAFNRFRTSNIAMQDDIRLELEMFEFIPPTIKWINELGERLEVDWLGLDEEEEIDEVDDEEEDD
ncbi:MAG: hypothetical protein INQ03_23640 [Candidatus Heimdallarchaeota archaeon]|nr:hypothetical protein [Candidatus Heimdallarchaeota archaeon]